MNRRNVLKNASLGSIGLLVGSASVAHSTELRDSFAELQLSAQISRNHGHKVVFQNLDEIILLLRAVSESGPKDFDIQGDSRHAHSIKMTQSVLLDLLIKGEVEVTSSMSALHTHNVRIILE